MSAIIFPISVGSPHASIDLMINHISAIGARITLAARFV